MAYIKPKLVAWTFVLYGCVCWMIYSGLIMQRVWIILKLLNRLKPNDPYMGRTAPLISKRYILYIYSTNIGTEYFKHALYSPAFFFKMQFIS